MPIVKSISGKYIAVLSDDSIDRDDEIVSKNFLNKFVDNTKRIPALMDHTNKVANLVGEWVNKRMEKVNGHNAFVAEPKFYMSNPNAVMVKGMLDEGAEVGVSIGAIVTNTSEVTIDNKEYRQFDDGEILEASFTPVPANKHARALAIAKSFKQNKEATNMAEENETPKEEPSELEAKPEDVKEDKSVDIEKQFNLKSEELEKKFAIDLEIKTKEIREELQKEFDLKINDRHDLLKQIKQIDDESSPDNSEEIAITKNVDVKPTAANFIAAMKGFDIQDK